ncbi:thiocillin family RiPP [Planomonospora sp. ID67723]|uniref:thiocillin family RiPP n=1 Tax=Planomonospora sp. ID67723 TaxID=2738134 RepID=UPI0018C3EA44|nr:thiocillin family RiPP [Planomonospora sp. ID67723]MBG0827794.1 thiocillin family RiPP [Planomonospora sp. ID67723]
MADDKDIDLYAEEPEEFSVEELADTNLLGTWSSAGCAGSASCPASTSSSASSASSFG